MEGKAAGGARLEVEKLEVEKLPRVSPQTKGK